MEFIFVFPPPIKKVINGLLDHKHRVTHEWPASILRGNFYVFYSIFFKREINYKSIIDKNWILIYPFLVRGFEYEHHYENFY